MNTCSECRWWRENEMLTALVADAHPKIQPPVRMGHCRRNPPVKAAMFTEWPSTSQDDWCGEWKGREKWDTFAP